MDGQAGIVKGRHIRIENGVVIPSGNTYSWWISPNLKDMKLEKGDLLRVNSFGGVPFIVVDEVFSELPENEKIPHKSTIDFFVKVPPSDMNWPPQDEEYRERLRETKKNRRKKEKKKKPSPRSFRARLRYVLEYRELGLEKISELAGMGISPTHIRKWTQGTDKPDLERIEGIAKALDVSPQWLAGTEDKPLAFDDKLRQRLTEGKWTRKKLGNATRIPREEIFLYTVGEKFPTIEQLRKIAEVLEVTPQWLAGNQ